jgi:hypothetical protein
MEQIKAKLAELIATPSDISEHLAKLSEISQGCEHITEMGVRGAVSTWAFISAKPKKFVGVDIVDCPVGPAGELARAEGIDFNFIQADTIANDFEIEETDFLFIDTLHTYDQLRKELAKHGNRARKYLGFHDTYTYAFVNEGSVYTMNYQGLRPAINQFVETNPHWTMHYTTNICNGLTILKRS